MNADSPSPARPLSRGLLSRCAELRPLVGHLGLALLGLLVLVLLWQVGALWLQRDLPLARMLSPGATFASLWELLASGSLVQDGLASLQRVGISLVLALLLGIPVGLALGVSKRLETGTSAAFQFLRMISPLSWMPVAVMVFGIGDEPIYFLLTITAIWPIILNTSAGVRELDPQWLQLARSLSATRLEMLFKVVLPGIFGSILTGIRLAVGMIWILLVPCEMLGVTSGLGYFILDTRDRLAYSELMAVIVVIGALGYLLDAVARSLQQRWSHQRLG